MPPQIIIGTSSFAQSGGSAITNILEEFSAFSVLKGGAEFECKFFTENIFALETALKIGNGIDKAVKAFLYNALQVSKDIDYKNNFGPDFLNYTIEYVNSVTENYLGAVHKDYDYAFLDPAEHAIFSKAQKLYNYKYGINALTKPMNRTIGSLLTLLLGKYITVIFRMIFMIKPKNI